MKYSTTIDNAELIPKLPRDLFQWFGLGGNAPAKEIDQHYIKLLNQKQLNKQQLRITWRILRDTYYAGAYEVYGSLPKIIEAGFFDDELEFNAVTQLHNTDLLTTPLHKIELNWRKHKTNISSGKHLVLLSTGGFSPLHEGHLEMLEIAKAEAEKKGFVVLGGYISPSHDSYVLTKAHMEQFGSSSQRVFQLQRELQDHPWLMVDPWESQYVPTAINFTDVVQRLTNYINRYLSFVGKIEVAYVYGSDHALFSRAFIKHGTGICVQRSGFSNQLMIAQTDKKLTSSAQIIYSSNFTLTANVSSQEIRKTLSNMVLPAKTSQSTSQQVYCVRDDLAWAIQPWLEKLSDAECQRVESLQQEFIKSLQNLIQQIVGMGCILIDVEVQQKNVQKLMIEGTIITNDLLTDGHYRLHVTRQFEFADGQIFPTKLIARTGFAALSSQFKNIPSGTYTLVDDDIASRITINSITKMLPKRIRIKRSISLLDKYIQLQLPKNTEMYDVVDARDFLLGSKQGGLVVNLLDGRLGRAIYAQPYVSLVARAKIHPNKEREFSINVWQLNLEFFRKFPKVLRLKDCDAACQNLLIKNASFSRTTSLEQISQWHLAQLQQC